MTEVEPNALWGRHRGPRSGSRLARASRRPALICLLLAAITIAVYGQVIRFEFINYDDADYVVENAPVQAGLTWRGIGWALGTRHAGNWHPLTWVSHMLDVEVFGTGAAGPHAVNLAIHTANVVLLFLLLNRLTGSSWRSAFVAGLFALHPLHVESVAWVSERKDVLSAFFFLLTLLAYARYVEKSRVHSAQTTVWYGLALACFTLGLMSKPMLVTLPFVLLLLDYWPLRRLGVRQKEESRGTPHVSRFTFHVSRITALPLLLEKLPFLALSIASCVVTFVVQRQAGAMQPLSRLSWLVRVENSLVSYARYLAKALWPAHLAVPYPHPITWPLTQVVFSAALVAGFSVAAVWLRRRHPYVFVGWFWFLGMLIPVIGLVQVGFQAMADRYSYLPLVGVFVLLTWAAGDLYERWAGLKPILAAGAALLLLTCAFLTFKQTGYWRNSGTLASHAIAVTKDNATAYANLGNYLLKLGQLDEAIATFQRVFGLLPAGANSPADVVAALAGTDRQGDQARERYLQALRTRLGLAAALPDVLNSLGNALARKGQIEEAIQHYRAALRMRPNYAEALNNLAYELAERKDYAQAIELYTAAARAKPEQLKIRTGLGDALMHSGRIEEAIAQLSEAVRLSPNDADTRNRVGLALVAVGRPADAIPQYEAALRADPKMLEVHNNLGSALLSVGNVDQAIRHFQLLLQTRPDHAGAHDNLGVSLAAKGQLDEAITHLRQAIRLQPDNANTHFNLGNVLASQRKFEEAAVEYGNALRLVPAHAQAHCHLGAVLAELGRRDEAGAHLREALRLKPDYQDAREQLQALGP